MDSALKLRLVTGLVLIACVLVGVLLFPAPLFAVAALVVFISVGGWEWGRLVALDEFSRGLFVVALLAVALLCYLVDGFRWVAIISGVFWWALALVLLAVYEQGTDLYKQHSWVLRLAAFAVLVPAWVAVITLQIHYPILVLYLIFLVAIADSAAYFTGKILGKNKLAPDLSPGKTREGVLGGLAGVTLWSILGALYFHLSATDWFYFIFLSIAVGLLSVAGDLFESLVKREAGMKDSGTILPGHGGILDRIDGLLAALPLFTLGIFWGAVKIAI